MRQTLVLLLLAALPCWSQTAQLSGSVTDPTSQAIANAAVTVVNEANGARRDLTTNEEGLFLAPALTPGRYTVRVVKEGFKTLERAGVELTVDARSRLDLRLDLGATSESVSVVENIGSLQVDSPEIAKTVTQGEYQNLPLVQLGRVRVAVAFVYLTAGVQGNVSLNGTDNLAASNQIRVHGSNTFQHEVWVDGLPAGQMGSVGNFNESAPPVEAMREFKLQTAQLAADYGHTGQAVTSFVLKQGTNRLHGSAFEFFRNDKLDTRSWFAAQRAITRQNEFGANLGGPVWIPKIYNGRDRTFFFFSWTSSRRRGLDNFSRVQIPTVANRQGDFSDFRSAAGQPVPIYDPSTTRANPAGGFIRDIFPGSRIPTTRFDPVAARIAAFYPAPNQVGALNLGEFIGEAQLDPNIFTIRGDHSLTTNSKLFFSFNSTDIPRRRVDSPLPQPLTSGIIQGIQSQMYRLGHDWVARPNLLNSFVIGVNRFRNPVQPLTDERGWPERLGLRGVFSTAFPVISFGDGYVGLSTNTGTDNIDAVYMAKNTVNWTRGRSNWRMGGEYRWNHLNDRSTAGTQGTMTFNNLATALPGSPAGSGNSFASFLLGEIGSGSVNLPIAQGSRRSYTGFFVQNDYKLSSRLTINAGLRFEYQGAPFEQWDRYSLVDLGVANPRAGGRPGALIFAGNGTGRTGTRRLAQRDLSGWGPRVGIAWNLRPRTVTRAGYGIYYAHNYLSVSGSGFNPSGTFQTLDNGITPGFRLRDGYPDFPRDQRIDPSLLNGQAASYLDANAGAMPRTQNFSFGIQQELFRDLVLEVNYVGNRSTRQVAPQLLNINQVHPRFLELGSLLTQNIASPAARAANIPIPFAGFNGSVAQALRDYPQHLTLTSQQAKVAMNNYNGAEFKVRKRFNSGLSFEANYTWSKNLGYNSPAYQGFGGTDNMLQDHFNLRAERAVIATDVPHAFVAHYVMPLPFGKQGPAKFLIGGWTLAGIHRYQAGYPIPILMNNLLPVFNRVLRPDLVGAPASGLSNGDFDPGRGDRIVNPASFASPVQGTNFRFGTLGPARTDIRQFPVLQEDLTLTKKLDIREKVNVDFTVQIFNAFNRHRFVNFEPNFSSPNFGRTRGTNLPRFIQLGARLSF